MKALVIGATGATGTDLVTILLQSSAYTEVVTFVRRTTGAAHPKLKEIITDFENLDAITENINGDVLFSCLGTTLKTAGSKNRQYHIDYEIPAAFATVAKTNGVHTIVLLSAYGASAKSNVFYSQIKGKLEDTIEKLGFDSYIIFRPGLLLRKNTDRAGEKIFAGILKWANRIGLFKKFKPMPTELLALKMAKAPQNPAIKKQVIELDNIFAL